MRLDDEWRCLDKGNDDEGDKFRENPLVLNFVGIEWWYGEKIFRRFRSWWWLCLVSFIVDLDFFSVIFDNFESLKIKINSL